MQRWCWQCGLGILIMLGFSIAVFTVATRSGSEHTTDQTRILSEQLPILIWQIDDVMDRKLSLTDKPRRLYLDSSTSVARFRFQLATDPSVNSAHYRLVGQDTHWQPLASGITVLNYTALPTGHYRLEVQLSTPPKNKIDRVYSIADIWVASAWGRTSRWVVLAVLVTIIAWIGVTSWYNRRKCLGTDVNIEPGSSITRIQTSSFLAKLAEECQTSLMLMASSRELQQTSTHASRGFERLRGLVQQLHYYSTDHPYISQHIPIVLRSWLLPRLDWYCRNTERERFHLQILMIPDAVVTLDSTLLDKCLNTLISNACEKINFEGNLSFLCMLDQTMGMLTFRIISSHKHDSGAEPDDSHKDIAFELILHSLAISGGSYQRLQDDNGNIGWELNLPASWHLLQGIAPDFSQISVPTSPTNAPKLLIVESDPDMSPLLFAWLGDEYRLLFSSTIRGVLERAQEETIDLVLCTARWLPDGKPRELLSRLKEATETNHLPFILCSANANPDSEASAWHRLADDYLTLPLEPNMLRLRLQALLENRQRVRAWLQEHLIFGEEKDNPQSEAMTLPRGEGLDRQFSDELYTQACRLLGQATISVETLADRMGVSSRTLQRKLQSLFGINYSDYVRKIQMQLVVSQLQQGASVKTAARIAGFRDQAYLTRVFRQTFSMSPTEYRKRFVTSDKLT